MKGFTAIVSPSNKSYFIEVGERYSQSSGSLTVHYYAYYLILNHIFQFASVTNTNEIYFT
jgi:hypothetical protein